MADKKISSDVVKHGYMYIKRPPCFNHTIRLKAWQKKYVILRDFSLGDGVSTIELYDSEESFKGNVKPSYILDLKNVANIDSYDDSKRFANAFVMVRPGQRALVMGCVCNVEKQSWIQALRNLSYKRQLIYKYQDFNVVTSKVMSNNDRRPSCPGRINFQANSHEDFNFSAEFIKGRGWTDSVSDIPARSNGPPTTPRTRSNFSINSLGNELSAGFIESKCNGLLVHMQPTSDAIRNRLSGEYYMNVTPAAITLTSVASLREAIRWPMSHIKRFRSEDNDRSYQQLSLDASRFCGNSQGNYSFKTSHGVELVNKVKTSSATTPEPKIYKRHITHSYQQHMQTTKKEVEVSSSSEGAADGYLQLVEGEALHPHDAVLQPLQPFRLHENADSGFDDSDEDRALNDSLDVFIPPSSRDSVQPARPLPPQPDSPVLSLNANAPPVPPRKHSHAQALS